MSDTSPLSRRDERRALDLGFIEGFCFAAMVGLGESWFVPFAIDGLGAGAAVAGLVIGIPLGLGSLGALGSMTVLRRVGRRRPLVIAAVAAQALVLATLPLTRLLGDAAVPALLGALGLYHVAAQLAGTTWASWFGDVVHERIRGRYFGRRTRAIHLTTLLSLMAAGQIVDWLPAGRAEGFAFDGYTLLFALAALVRMTSAVLMVFTPEPRFRGLPRPGRIVDFLRTRRGAGAARLLLVAAALNFTVYLSSPYFAPFMLEEIRLDGREYALASAAIVLAKVATLRRWGAAVDRHGAFPVYALSLLLVAIVPLPWMWTHGIAWALAAQLFSGVAWGAYEIANFSILLESASARIRPLLFAGHNIVVGNAQLLGAVAGKELLAWKGYLLVFGLGAAARLLVGAMGPLALRSVVREPAVGRREILLRVVGFRPHGGLTHRPILRPPPLPAEAGPDGPPGA